MKIGYLMQLGEEIRRPPFNGPANHVRHVVQALTQRGHQVRLLVRLDGQLWKTDNLVDFEPVTAPWLDGGPLRWFERVVRRVQYELRLPYAGLFESVRFAVACVQELKGFDLLYERISWPEFGSALATRWLNVPLVLEDNGDALTDLEAKGIAPQGVQRWLSVTLMGWAVKQAAHVVSTGAGWRAQFIKRWGVEPARVSAVENGTTLVQLLSREQLNGRVNGRNPAQGVTLVYVGGFYPWHGLPVLLPALARARASGLNARLVLIGSGTGFQQAQQLVDELGLAGAVTFTGQLKPEEYAPLLVAADIGVSPYCGWPEFSGLKILDYKAAGLPTIASGQNGQPPTLQHEQTGLIVPPCDEAALTNAIIRLGADAELRRRMGQAARGEAEQIHGWDYTVAQLEQIFTKLLAERGRA